MAKLIDITGQRFGRFTVIRKAYTRKGIAYWECKCDCGNVFCSQSRKIREGLTRSCGCLAKDLKKHPNRYEFEGDKGICYFNTGGFFIFDKEDYDKIKDLTWQRLSTGYVMNQQFGGKATMVHRLIMDCPEGMVVDHINHNTLDNRKCNLRICTSYQNLCNHKAKGYSKEKSGKYRAYLGKIHLGNFNTEKEAIKARKEAELKYWGEYAYKEV